MMNPKNVDRVTSPSPKPPLESSAAIYTMIKPVIPPTNAARQVKSGVIKAAAIANRIDGKITTLNMSRCSKSVTVTKIRMMVYRVTIPSVVENP